MNLTTTTSLPELEEKHLFSTSEIQMFEISPLLQHPVLSLEGMKMFVVMIRGLRIVFHTNLQLPVLHYRGGHRLQTAIYKLRQLANKPKYILQTQDATFCHETSI